MLKFVSKKVNLWFDQLFVEMLPENVRRVIWASKQSLSTWREGGELVDHKRRGSASQDRSLKLLQGSTSTEWWTTWRTEEDGDLMWTPCEPSGFIATKQAKQVETFYHYWSSLRELTLLTLSREFHTLTLHWLCPDPGQQ